MEQILNRILSDIDYCQMQDKLYSIHQPTREQIFKADCLYQELLYDLSFEGWIRTSDTKNLLIKMNLWSKNQDDRLTALSKQLEDLKVQIYKAYLDTKKVTQLKKSINNTVKNIELLQRRLVVLDHITLEHYIKNMCFQYLTAICIYDSNNSPVYTEDSFWFEDPNVLIFILHYLNSNRISHTDIRKLAHCDIWRSIWNIGKETVFKKPIIELGENQRILAMFSKMYDNVYSHMECPDDQVIEDDDMLDGWMLHQQRQRKQEMAQKQIDNITSGKHKNASEIGIPVGNLNDIDKINQMNDFHARTIRKNRQQVLEKKGKVDEQKFTDVQQDLHAKAQKQFMDTVKGTKK